METGCILVAGGYGYFREHNGDRVPKILERIGGIPLFVYVLRAVEAGGVTNCVMVVNNLYHDAIRNVLDEARWKGRFRLNPKLVIQEDRYGAAHAVWQAIPSARDLGMKHALIAYGDMPCWSGETIRRVLTSDAPCATTATMLTVERAAHLPELNRYGRVVRCRQGKIARIEEVGPGLPPELYEVPIVNPSLWKWDVDRLAAHLRYVKPVARPDGRHPECHLPPLVQIVAEAGEHIHEVRLHPNRAHEALGVNDVNELERVRSLMNQGVLF